MNSTKLQSSQTKFNCSARYIHSSSMNGGFDPNRLVLGVLHTGKDFPDCVHLSTASPGESAESLPCWAGTIACNDCKFSVKHASLWELFSSSSLIPFIGYGSSWWNYLNLVLHCFFRSYQTRQAVFFSRKFFHRKIQKVFQAELLKFPIYFSLIFLWRDSWVSYYYT